MNLSPLDAEKQARLLRLSDAQLERAIYSSWDFQQALSALIFLSEDFDFEHKYGQDELRRFRCYETSIVVSFCRPFEICRGTSVLGLKTIGIVLESEEAKLKERLLALRRKVVAHSDEKYMHFQGMTFQPLEDSTLRLPMFSFSERLHLSKADLAPLEKLLRKLIRGISMSLWVFAQYAPDRLDRFKAPPCHHASIGATDA